MARSPPRHSRLAPQPAVCRSGDPVAGARHRRQYRHLHADRPDPAAQAAGEGPRAARDAVPAGQPQRQQHGRPDALVSDLPGLPAEGPAALAGHLPAPRCGVGGHRQPDRTRLGRDGVGQLLRHARRPSRRGPCPAFRRGRPGLQRPSGRRPEPRLLGVEVREEPWRHRQEDPDQQLPDDDRGRVGRRLCRHRPRAVASDPGAHPDEAGDAAGMGMDAGRRPARPVGAGVCTPEARPDGRKRRRADAGSVHADPAVRGDAARRQGLVGVFEGPVPQGHPARRESRHRVFEPAQRLLHCPDRADVHGRPGAAHLLRQRRQPAHRAWLHAPAGDRRPLVARRDARPAGPPAAGRKPRALGDWRADGGVCGRRVDTGAARAHPVGKQPAVDPGGARSAHPWFHVRAHAGHGHRLRAAARPARQPAGSMDDVEGHGRHACRFRRIAVPAQGARDGAGGVEFPAAVWRRALRAQSPEPAHH